MVIITMIDLSVFHFRTLVTYKTLNHNTMIFPMALIPLHFRTDTVLYLLAKTI